MMHRFTLIGFAAAIGLLTCGSAIAAGDDARSLPMQFTLQREGPAETCGNKCRIWVSAVGAIAADTPLLFERFAKGRNLHGAALALDSDGGSVLGALSLGRAIRRLGMTTTVGRTIEEPASAGDKKRVRLLSDAFCESMCTFVLLAGVERHVPSNARVLVHQIWLGDRREDPTAASYSAEDLVVVQRDIGSLAQYTIEMGGTIDLLALTLKIPPWEQMHTLTREELRGTRLVTGDDKEELFASAAVSASTLASGTRSSTGDRSWIMVKGADRPAIARRHPLTVEGENVGTFDLTFSCGSAGQYVVTYVEKHHASKTDGAIKSPRNVELKLADKSVALKVSSLSDGKSVGRAFTASGTIPTGLVKAFAEPRNLSMTVEASNRDDKTTVIRLGNAGLARSLSELTAACAN